MPHFLVKFEQGGPLVDAFFGVTPARRTALAAAGQPVPPAVRARVLIDTGASSTCVDPSVIAQLAIPPTGSIPIHTPSTTGTAVHMNQYDVTFIMPGAAAAELLVVDAMPVIESQLRPQGIDGLIGRDVLSRCLMVFDGRNALLTLSF